MPSRSRAGHRGYNARRVGEFAADMLVALAWVALVVLILAFAGGGSNFIYIDF